MTALERRQEELRSLGACCGFDAALPPLPGEQYACRRCELAFLKMDLTLAERRELLDLTDRLLEVTGTVHRARIWQPPTGPAPWELRVMAERPSGRESIATAYHEAGHCVQALSEGRSVTRAEIHWHRDGTGAWRAQTGRVDGTGDSSRYVSLAGPVAEDLFLRTRRFLEDVPLWGGDRKKYNRRVRCDGGAMGFAWDRDHVEHVLRSFWAGVEALATVLLERGRVTGAEAERIVLGALDASARERLKRAA
jgi:hypothetical protein